MCVVFVFCVMDFEACALGSKFESFAFVLFLLVGMVFADIGLAQLFTSYVASIPCKKRTGHLVCLCLKPRM